MHLEECLNRIPSDRLTKVLARYDSSLAEQETVDASRVASVMMDAERLRDALLTLTEEECAALKIIVFACAGRGVVVEQCHQKLNRMTRKWRRNGALVIDSLMQLGLVFTDRAHYRQVYFVPSDLRSQIVDVLGPDLVASVSVEGVETVEAGDDPNLALRTIHFLLSYVRKSGVRITQNGEIFRRSQKGLAETLGISDATGDPSPERPGNLRHMLDYLRSRGLVRQVDGVLDVAPDKADSWINQEPWKKRVDMFRYWEECLLEQDSDFSTILGFLELIPEGKWALVRRLIETLEPVGIGHSWQALPLRLEKHFFKHLSSAGILRIGQLGEELACCLTPIGRLIMAGAPPTEEDWARSFFVEPNFELLVPRDIHPEVLWAIEHVADLTKNDHVMVYLVTRSSVYRSLKDGKTGEEIVSFLAEHSRNPVPQNVSYSILNWSSRFGRVRFVNSLVLHCDSAELAAEIQSITAIKEFIIGSYTDKDLVIDRSKYESFLEALQEYGFMPLPGLGDPIITR